MNFYLFVISVDGMLGKESLVVLVNLSQLMAAKMKESISHVHDWINDRIAITVAIMYSCMIRGACLHSPLWDRDPVWESDFGLGLEQ